MRWILTSRFRLVCFLFAVGACFVVPATSSVFALEANTDCLACHEAGQLFDVAPVDRDTVCVGCHTPGLLGTHPYHQVGANCGAFCHPGWGETLQTAVPLYSTSAGSFASNTSINTSAEILHQIHSSTRWPADVTTSESECSSCHLPAACTACHADDVSAPHQAHSSTENEPWSGMVCFGVVGEDQSVRSATLDSNLCATSDCHDLAGIVSNAPLLKENFSHAAQPDYGYPEANSVTLTGTWSTIYKTDYTAGRQSVSNYAGSTLSVAFTGSRVTYVTDVDPYRGYAEVWLDGEFQGTIDNYAPVTKRQQTLWVSELLDPGSHTITIKATGTKNASSRGAWAGVDAFLVYPHAGESIAPACTAACHAGFTTDHGSGSHSMHITSDPRGPGALSCSDCHLSSDFPYFAEGVDEDSSGHIELAETTACDQCHSPGGDYDGVESGLTASGRMSVGAKDNWAEQVYETTATLQPGKEKWCAGCHDGEEEATADAAGLIAGVFAPPVIGDEDAGYIYGTGYGFYETGHGTPTDTVIPSNGFDAGPGMECDGCHDYTQPHIDGDRRSFSATDTPDDYRTDYRLALVDGENPMLIPRPWNSGNSPDSYRLCTQSGCHDPYPFITETAEASATPSLRQTNFWNENTDWGHNMHKYHIGMNQSNRWAPDWGPTKNSLVTCISCHNVHGSRYLGMIHDGSLISDTVTRTPGLRIWYRKSGLTEYAGNNQYPPTPEDITLAMSDGWIWCGGSSGNLCSHCHGNFNTQPVDRILWQDYGIAPVLAWVGSPGHENDGANPDAASADETIEFKISYLDANNDAPLYVSLLIDLNDDGDFSDPDEVKAMDPDSPMDATYFNGNCYTVSVAPAKAGDGQLDYRFETSDGVTGVSTTPTRTITVENAMPDLGWTGETGFTSDGVNPNGGTTDITDYEFRITYRDADEEAPLGGAPSLFIDADDDGDYSDELPVTMTDMGDPSFATGKRYTHTTTLTGPADGTLAYYFEASDGTTTTQSAVSTVTVLPDVNLAPSLAWTGEADYVDDGVDPENQAATKPFDFRIEYTDANNDPPSMSQVWIDLDDSGAYDPGEKFPMDDLPSVDDPDMNDADFTNGEIFAETVYIPYAGDGTLDYCFYFEDDSGVAATGVQETNRTLSVYDALYVPSAYATIQLAVDAASDGDTVLVNDGTYLPFAFNGKDITVESVNGRDATVIQTSSGTGSVVSFNDYGGSGSDSTLRGFTVRYGQTGIYTAKSDATIEDCIIEDITFNGAIYHTGAAADPLVVRDTIIRNNTRYCVRIANNDAIAEFTDTDFIGNSCAYGGGAIIGNGTWIIDRCTFHANTTTAWGGALYCGGYIDLRVTESTFTSNTADNQGGAVYFAGNDTGTDAVIDRCVFAGNEAGTRGGALQLRLGDYEITNCTISGNYAGSNGGGIDTISSSRRVYTNCTIAGNSGTLGGGAWEYTWTGDQPVYHNCIVWGNDARSSVMDQLDGTGPWRIVLQYTDIDQGYWSFTEQVGNMRFDPYFIDPVAASSAPTSTGDYHLKSSSRCEGRGSAAYSPAVDIDNQARPTGTGPEPGSDEIGAP